VNQLDRGITYVRARIKLKSGETVYTYILPVLTSGANPVVFYPNPVRRGEVLNYVSRQGLQPGSTIRLFDINGRLLKVAELGVNINTDQLPAGVIIYKMFNGDISLLGTGKIVIL
jgi:hypothetical protein